MPDSLGDVGDALIDSVPQRYLDHARRYYGDAASAGDELYWRALGFLIEDGRALRLREVLTGFGADPLKTVYESAGHGGESGLRFSRHPDSTLPLRRRSVGTPTVMHPIADRGGTVLARVVLRP